MQHENSLDEHDLLALIDFENGVPCVQVLCIWVSGGSTKHPSLVKQQGIADSCREDQDKFSAASNRFDSCRKLNASIPSIVYFQPVEQNKSEEVMIGHP